MNKVDKILTIQVLTDKVMEIEHLKNAVQVRGAEVLELQLAIIAINQGVEHLKKWRVSEFGERTARTLVNLTTPMRGTKDGELS